MTMDLDQDYTINGQTFTAGKKVDTVREVADPNTGKTQKVDFADGIKEMQNAAQESAAYASTHHGAVPEVDDPNEATAQTPTRPLAAPHLRADEHTTAGAEQENVHEVEDPSGNGADESNKSVKK